MNEFKFSNKQMLVMGPSSWPKETQARVFSKVNTAGYQTIVRRWPEPLPVTADYLSVAPDWDWSNHYPKAKANG